MKSIRELMDIVEARLQGQPDSVEYHDADTKVTAQVKDTLSAKYTKLAKNMMRIDELTEEIKQLQSDVKQQRREDVAELFDVEDAVFTRVIETRSVIFTLSKDPKATEAPQYKTILGELEKHLTPELIQVLEALKREHVTITQKEPSLKYQMRSEQAAESSSSPLIQKVNRWIPRFDQRLNSIKSAL